MKASKNTDSISSLDMIVSERISELRAERNLSIRALAAKAGLSAGLISRVESHQSRISLGALEKVAIALEVPYAAFFHQDESENPIILSRGGERPLRPLTPDHLQNYEPLALSKKGKMMEPFIGHFISKLKKPTFKSHPGEEFFYVLEGEINLHYGKQIYELSPGDSAYYEARIPHGFSVRGKKAVQLLGMVTSKDYSFHGDLELLLNFSKL